MIPSIVGSYLSNLGPTFAQERRPNARGDVCPRKKWWPCFGKRHAQKMRNKITWEPLWKSDTKMVLKFWFQISN